MKTIYFPIQSTSLAHYFGAAIIKPAKYFTNKPHDLQDEYGEFLLFTTNMGTTETDCCLEIALTDDEEKKLINVNDGWFLYAVNPLPISRIVRIIFSDQDKRDTTITNIRMSTAYVPERLIEVCKFDHTPTSNIKVPTSCRGVEKKESIIKYNRFLGALALMKTVGEPYMNYSPNYILTLSFFNTFIEEQLNRVIKADVKKSYQGLFDNSKGFEHVLPYLESQIDEQTVYKIAEKNKQEIIKDKVTRIIDINSLTDTWTYTIAILNTYGVGEEARRKKIDGLIQSHFSSIKKEKAEGVALCYGYNRGYSVFSKDYIIDENGESVSYKYKLESQLDYYTIESVYQYVFNGVVSRTFPYLDEWCPKKTTRKPQRKTDYIILDEVIIGKRKAKVFSEEWWNGLFQIFNKEFGRFAQENFRFFQEMGREMKNDIEDEQKELVSQYENKLNEYKKKIDELTKQLEQKTEENISLQHQLKKSSMNVVDNSDKDYKKENLKSLTVGKLKELAKQKGLNVPNKPKKEDLIKLLTSQQSTTFDIPFEPDNK